MEPWSSSKRSEEASERIDISGSPQATSSVGAHKQLSEDAKRLHLDKEIFGDGEYTKHARTFTFEELSIATQNFSSKILGSGGFGDVYMGVLLETNESVAIKKLNHYDDEGIGQFVVELSALSIANHPNLVTLIGFCAQGDQRLLVYEHMPFRCLERHLHYPRQPLDWTTRMKIAAGVAKGLEYLHVQSVPPIIHRDLKSSNVLLGEGYHPKLSDFGLAKLGPGGDQTHVSTAPMGTYGYSDPEYAATGHLTFKSDIYSFGVLLLELVTGKKALDVGRDVDTQNLVDWATPFLKDEKSFPKMVDPLLKNAYPDQGLHQALSLAANCVEKEAKKRPGASEVVTALNFLATMPSSSKNMDDDPDPEH